MAERPGSIIKEESPAALSRRIDELLELQRAYQLGVGDSGPEAGQTGLVAKLIDLRDHIWNVRNRTPLSARSTRKVLFKLAKRIDAALNGVERQRAADISEAKEHDLRTDLFAAKTNRERRRLGQLIAQQHRDRELVSKHRMAATPEHEIARRRKQIYKGKKASRVFNKLRKTVQISACARNSPDLKSDTAVL
jgi:hypothetical protein